jgi:phytoene dehydrogenase-like protein
MDEKSIIIIGAGIAGLSAGCYAQMNGYGTRIFEMHDKPGGLVTAWERRGYTIDGCLHWLVGSAPGIDLYRWWKELGLLEGKKVIDLEQFYRYEAPDGRAFTMYCNIDRLEQHMKELSPADSALTSSLAQGMRRLARMEMPMEKAPELQNLWDKARTMGKMLPYMKDLASWANLTVGDLVGKFQSQLLRDGLAFWPREFSTMALLMTVAYVHNKTAGYVIGGSLPLMRALEKRYTGLGGHIDYQSKVVKIVVEGERAAGVRLANGEEHRADYVVSAGDGHAAIFDLLDGKYVNDAIRGYYNTLPIFTPILYVSLGVARRFDELPQLISGLTIGLEDPVAIGGKEQSRLHVRINNFDPTMAPAGKSVLSCMIDADYDYWKKLRQQPALYRAEKARALAAVTEALERRFPGLKSQVEMADVATPVTFERYTGNWQGSYEGFLITPKTQRLQIAKTLPGLAGFFMVGQWVSPGGGLPSGVMTGRYLAQVLCRKDGRKFQTTLPQPEPA